MKKMTLPTALFLLVPALAAAQVPPPAPPAPPAPVAPMPPVAPMAPLAPLPRVIVPSLSEAFVVDRQAIEERARAMADDARVRAEQYRVNLDDYRVLADQMRAEADRVRGLTFTSDFGYELDQQLASAMATADSERSAYDRGQSALSARQYEQAVALFDKAIAAKGTRTDGALYWKAWALAKLGRSADANATLDTLQKSYKDSKYLADVKVLESEIKRLNGQAMRPEAEDDEDLKLLALQGLINSDPERAIPLVQGVLQSAGSLKLKDKALYVLALSNSAQAHTILVNVAKTGTPDLQAKAISYLSVNRRSNTGGKTTIAELVEIYASAQNDVVKRAIISAIGSSSPFGSFNYAVNLTGQNALAVAEARAAAPRPMATTGTGSAASTPDATATEAQNALWSLYQKEASKDLRGQILSTLGSMGATDRVMEVARSEKDTELRNRAIRSLGNSRAEKSGQALAEIYGSLDQDGKKSVVQALGNQGNAEALITIVRKETDRELKRSIVERLASMPKNKAAQDYLMEIIK